MEASHRCREGAMDCDCPIGQGITCRPKSSVYTWLGSLRRGGGINPPEPDTPLNSPPWSLLLVQEPLRSRYSGHSLRSDAAIGDRHATYLGGVACRRRGELAAALSAWPLTKNITTRLPPVL